MYGLISEENLFIFINIIIVKASAAISSFFSIRQTVSLSEILIIFKASIAIFFKH